MLLRLDFQTRMNLTENRGVNLLSLYNQMTYKNLIVRFHVKKDIKMKKMNQNVHEIDRITAHKIQ
jgi:hypothetical protein